jgi:lipopolysaccharide transport system permease protein
MNDRNAIYCETPPCTDSSEAAVRATNPPAAESSAHTRYPALSPSGLEPALAASGPDPTVVIQPRKGLFHLDLVDIWHHRELLYFLIWREHKVRYKQTAIGAAWAILQPLITMAIFTVIFGIFARIPSDGLPYPVFAYSALLPWNFFSQALSRSSASLVNNAGLITKVYFPRLMIPFSAALVPVVDFIVSFLMLLGLMAWFHIVPTWKVVLALPLLMILTLVTSLSVSLWLASLNVKYRDIGYTVPFLLQVWMYASPVVYPISLVPKKWQFFYCLNPMAGVIESFRWALLGKDSPNALSMAIGMTVVIGLLIGGMVYFRKIEGTFSDVV